MPNQPRSECCFNCKRKCLPQINGQRYICINAECNCHTPSEPNKGEGKMYETKTCDNCGEQMEQVWDDIAKKYTGHLWHCKCMKPNFNLSIG